MNPWLVGIFREIPGSISGEILEVIYGGISVRTIVEIFLGKNQRNTWKNSCKDINLGKSLKKSFEAIHR